MEQKKPLEIYIHIPFCVKKCQYCDFLSFGIKDERLNDLDICPTHQVPVPDIYIDALCSEIEWYGKQKMFRHRPVVSVFFGGGTPSLLSETQMFKVMSKLREHFMIQKEAEITVEANPGTVTLEKLKKFHQYGINRLSMGLQSADTEELKILGRIHNFDVFLKSFQWAREAGFKNINVDLIMAVPNQTVDSYKKTLLQVLDLEPEHISAYSLIIEPDTPFEILEEEGRLNLPDEDSERQMYYMTQEILKASGYERYEISNYAKPGYACRHNIGYWNRTDYIGLGLGASSLIEHQRFSNTENMSIYIEENGNPLSVRNAPEVLDEKSIMEEIMFLGLRMTQGVKAEDFLETTGKNMSDVYGDVIEKYVTNGLLECSNGRICLTNRGLDVANSVMADFLL